MSESPTARALRALENLQARPGISADRLADRLGVSERAARRYVATLREAGVPVESERGPYGGYRLGRGLRLPPLVFSATEALGLVMAALDGHHAAADTEDPVGSALGKILRVLPENVGRQASLMREHAATAPDRVAARPDPATTRALVAAVAAQRRTRIGYRSASGRTHTFLVDPWAVVVRYGRWYLLCRAHHADPAEPVRTYRVDRVGEVVQTDEGFDLPAGLDPVAALEAHLGRGWEHPTRVLLEAPLAEVAPWVRPAMGRLSALGDDRCLLEGSTNNPQM
jgi:predicted DNA-binding transcriptional regulator YafY